MAQAAANAQLQGDVILLSQGLAVIKKIYVVFIIRYIVTWQSLSRHKLRYYLRMALAPRVQAHVLSLGTGRVNGLKVDALVFDPLQLKRKTFISRASIPNSPPSGDEKYDNLSNFLKETRRAIGSLVVSKISLWSISDIVKLLNCIVVLIAALFRTTSASSKAGKQSRLVPLL